MSVIRMNINGLEVNGWEGQTILDIAKAYHIAIPTLCHDGRVHAYGACGVCVVEAEGAPRPVRACSTLATEGLIIKTDTPKVKAVRKAALELLLSNHTGDCRPPCVLACPAQTDCQGYVGLIANGRHKEALRLIKERIPLPASIGRVCPHPCESDCRRRLLDEPIDIAHLKQFAADLDFPEEEADQTPPVPESGRRVAVIGGGPGGLSAAFFLRQKGHAVTVYDAMPNMGGMLVYGIPEYRLPKAVVAKEIRRLEKSGIDFVNGMRVGKDVSFDYINSQFDATVLAVGAWRSLALGCPGESLSGVVGGIDFLRDVAQNNTMLTGKKIAVVGGGNTAMDACRTAIRLGADMVYNIYRRTKSEMPAEPIEIAEAEEEGVLFRNLTNPIEIIGENGRVVGVRLQLMALGAPDESGRRAPVPIDGAEETLSVDTVIVAIGQGLDMAGLDAIALTKRGTVAASEATCQTNLPGVFAVGDATNKGADIAIAAIAEAKKAAEAIGAYLNGDPMGYTAPFGVIRSDADAATDFSNKEKVPRVPMRRLRPRDRKENFREVNRGFTESEAMAEAVRCLECGCHDYFECRLVEQANTYAAAPERLAGAVLRQTVADDHPLIRRNPDKCILCGLCVRICDETMGITALGLANRGFETTVQPALGLPLRQSGCIACGQCVHVCPTGALTEVTAAEKQVPVAETSVEGICAYCGVGCRVTVTMNGGMALRCLPDTAADPNAILCARGRFGARNPFARKKKPLTRPLIRKNGLLSPADFHEAYVYVTKKIMGITARHGANSIAVVVSDQYANEDIYAIVKYAREILAVDNVFSFNRTESGLKQTLGVDASTVSLAELMVADVILVTDTNLLRSHTVAAVRIRQRVREGARLIVLAPHGADAYLSDVATVRLESGQSLFVLKQLIKALIDLGLSPQNAEGFEALKQSVEGIFVSAPVQEAAECYAAAKNAVIVFDQNAVSTDAARLLAAVALVGGHIGKARNGIVQLKPNVNSQGLADLGVLPAAGKLTAPGGLSELKGMLLFGEDIPAADLSGLEFLMAADAYLTETAEKADVVLPFADLLSTDGSVTNSFGQWQRVQKIVPPASGVSNIEIIKGLANVAETRCTYRDEQDVLREITKAIPNIYRKAAEGARPILAAEGFFFEGGKARLILPEGDTFFTGHVNTYWAHRTFRDYLEQEIYPGRL